MRSDMNVVMVHERCGGTDMDAMEIEYPRE